MSSILNNLKLGELVDYVSVIKHCTECRLKKLCDENFINCPKDWGIETFSRFTEQEKLDAQALMRSFFYLYDAVFMGTNKHPYLYDTSKKRTGVQLNNDMFPTLKEGEVVKFLDIINDGENKNG
jgi:hypothetical protein